MHSTRSKCLVASRLPVFLFVHFMDIHLPFDPDGSVAGRFTDVYEDGPIGSNLTDVNFVPTKPASLFRIDF